MSTVSPSSDQQLDRAALAALYEETFKNLEEGTITEGRIVAVTKDKVVVDIGYKSEGVIPSKELSIRHDVDPNEVVKVGDKIEALVLQKEDKEGRLILSKKRAQYERAWGRIEEVMVSGETIKGEFSGNGVDNDISHTRGTISMARSTDPDSASSQFFIVQSDSTFLDGDYAAFGHVTEGMDIVDKICKEAAPTDENGSIKADEQPVIESIRMTD